MADFGKYYRAYMYMQDLLKNDFTYNYITESLKDGDKGEDTLDGKTNEPQAFTSWQVTRGLHFIRFNTVILVQENTIAIQWKM